MFDILFECYCKSLLLLLFLAATCILPRLVLVLNELDSVIDEDLLVLLVLLLQGFVLLLHLSFHLALLLLLVTLFVVG